jgi:hypothetical protein
VSPPDPPRQWQDDMLLRQPAEQSSGSRADSPPSLRPSAHPPPAAHVSSSPFSHPRVRALLSVSSRPALRELLDCVPESPIGLRATAPYVVRGSASRIPLLFRLPFLRCPEKGSALWRQTLRQCCGPGRLSSNINPIRNCGGCPRAGRDAGTRNPTGPARFGARRWLAGCWGGE